MTGLTILCPVDFSNASRGALRYGTALAEHFQATLVVMTAIDPLLAEAAAMETSSGQVRASALAALERFVAEAVTRPPATPVVFDVAIGKPAAEILRVARARRAELMVISSHGLTGFRRMFFGSTTERVLRETTVPVLVVRGDDHGPATLADAAARVRRVLAPVLLSPVNARQVAVVKGLAEALKVPALLLHVVEPLRAVLPHSDSYLSKVERERRTRAEAELDAIAGHERAEALIAYGEPSEEIGKVAHDRGVGLIVMMLQGSPLAGPRIGSVTYRVLSVAGCPILALPPAKARAAKAGVFSQHPKKSARAVRGQHGK